jgi:beta-lactamase regulating signal transducer with metallopeptidase domain/HEAT repeat protein
MKELYQLFDHPIIHRLGWTLLHFLWQGTGVAVVYALFHILLRKQASQWRYLLGCGALVVMLAAPITTFIVIGTHSKIRPSASVSGNPVEPAVSRGVGAVLDFRGARIVTGEAGAGAAQKFEGLIREFVLIWLVGVSALSLRLLLASRQVSRLRRSGTETLGESWNERIDRLRAALAISRPVSLVKSAMIEVPTLIGWLRPVILLPASTLTGLTPEQLETIIAHELAHVRRHDYLVNLLQNAVETLLFYHPAVWWVSNSVRVERENCCDDVALNVCGDRMVYAKALAALEHLRSSPAALALGADGGSLLERVRRLCGTPTRFSFGGRRKAGGALAAALVMMILMSVFRHPAGIADAEAKPQSGSDQPKPVPEWFNVKALADWVADLQSQDPNTRALAQRAIADMGINALPEFLKILDDKDRSSEGDHRRYNAAQALKFIRPGLKAGIPSFKQLLTSGDEESAYAGARALAVATTTVPEAFTELTNGLSHPAPGTRDAAAHGVGLLLGSDSNQLAESALPLLLRNLKDPADYVRADTAAALSGFVQHQYAFDQDAKADLIIPPLIECLHDKYSWARLYAATALADYGGQAKSAVPILATLLNDPDSQVRTTATGALNRIEADSSAAQQLVKARDEARLKAAAAEKKLTESGAPAGSLGFDRARGERDTLLAAARDSREKLAAYYRYANEAKRLERSIEDEVLRGVRPVDVREIARFERLQAEVEMALAQGRLVTGAPNDTIPDSSKPPVLEIRLVLEVPSADAQQMKLQHKINNTASEETLYVQRMVLFDQTGVKSASVTKDPVTGRPLIEVRLTDQGRERFAEVTRQNIHRRLAIILDGRLYSAPRILQEIPGGMAQISGDFSEDEARDLARRINEAVAK